MIMSFGVLSETQAATLIAASGSAKEGRIPIDALTQHAIDRFTSDKGELPPEAPAARAQVSLPGSKKAEEAIRAAAHPLPDEESQWDGGEGRPLGPSMEIEASIG